MGYLKVRSNCFSSSSKDETTRYVCSSRFSGSPKGETTNRLLFLLIFTFSVSLASAQTYLGDYFRYHVSGKAIIVYAGPPFSSLVSFTFYQPDILRVGFVPSPGIVDFPTGVVVQDTSETVDFSIEETDSTLRISSSAITIVCRKSPLRFSYFDASGKLLLAEPLAGGLAFAASRRFANFEISANDHYYGSGERGISLDLRGHAFDSNNTQNYGYQNVPDVMNINVPFVATTNGYALYFDHAGRSRFDFGASSSNKLIYTVADAELSYFIFAASTIPEQLENYTWLTGRQPLPPKWAFGFIQSKLGYENESAARATVETMRQKNIPCDAIVLDLYWFNQMGDLSWNLADWPNPFQMMRDFLDQGIKTIVIIEPYLTEFSSNFSEAFALGYLAKRDNGQTYLLDNWWSCNCNAGLLDMTNPTVQQWWWSKHPQFFGDELAGIWTDLGEPERHPDDMHHHLGAAGEIHNLYNFLWAKSIFEGFNEFRPNQRLFNLTRSGYAGIQRYGVVTWSGDVSRTFAGLSSQPTMLLNMGLSGIGYHNSDIGGFCCGFTTPELYVRWMQFGSFCPITRAHGAGQPTEPWEFGAPAEAISKKFIELRYQLLPYIYTLAYENYRTGIPLARPLLFADPNDSQLYNERSSYLFGDAFLVSPIVATGQNSKSVYLPRGKWVNFWDDQILDGGQAVTVAAPLEVMPLFVKSGSIIPMQSVMNFTDERQLDTLRLVIYPDTQVEGQFTLYEDDGETLDYQTGSFALTDFSQQISIFENQPAMFINLGPTTGSYTGKPARRVYLAEIHRVLVAPTGITKNGHPIPTKNSLADLRNGSDGFFYDSGSYLLYVQTAGSADSTYQIIVQNLLINSVSKNQPVGPNLFRLDQNYPNPFNPSTTISYHLSLPARVTLKIFDVLGRHVTTLVDSQQSAGDFNVEFNGDDFSASSGVYFYKLTTRPAAPSQPAFSETRRMVLAK